MLGDLTTLANVKAWLKINDASDDVILTRMISQRSRSILDYLQRPTLISQPYTDVSDGWDNTHQFLANWPVNSVTQVAVGSIIIPPAPIAIGAPTQASSYGWRLDPWDGASPGNPQAVELSGRRFGRGRLNISISYQAGYLVPAEVVTIAAGTYTAAQLLGPWSADNGVAYANGTVLTPVAAAPAVGQYVATGGVYTFNAADDGQSVVIAYSYTPGALEDACINWVAERYQYRGRIGERTRSLGSQTSASYDLSAVPAYIASDLAPYRKLLPIG